MYKGTGKGMGAVDAAVKMFCTVACALPRKLPFVCHTYMYMRHDLNQKHPLTPPCRVRRTQTPRSC